MKRGGGSLYRPTFKDKNGNKQHVKDWWGAWYAFDAKIGKRRQFKESLHTQKESEARKILATKVGADVKGEVAIPRADKVTYRDLEKLLLDDYRIERRKGLVRMTIACARLAEYFDTSTALQITAPRIDAYVKARRAAGIKDATIQVELSALRRMFTLARRDNVVAHAPYIRSLPLNNARQGFFERAEYETILAHLPEHLRPIFTYCYLTGWRDISEVFPLKWSEVDFTHGIVKLLPGTTKNKDGRTFPFHVLPELRDLMYAQRARVDQLQKQLGRKIEWVFPRPNGAQVRCIRKPWDRACRLAGLEGKFLYDCRRTAVRNLEAAGVPRSVAMSLTGHRTETVYRRYAIAVQSDQAAAVAKLAVLHGEQSGTIKGEEVLRK